MMGKKEYFPHLNLLRAFAAMTVMVYHVIRLKPWPEFPAHHFPFQWFDYGWMAVDIFFVLSGFVIMLAALGEMERADTRTARRHYLLKRLARILPLYFLTLFADLLIRQPEFLHNPDIVQHLLLHMTMLHNWSVMAHDSIDGPNWSLAFEMQFYLTVYMLMPWLARVRWQVLLGAVFAVAIAWRTGIVLIADAWGLDNGWKFIYAVQVPGMIDQLGLGMVFAKMVRMRHPLYQWLVRVPLRNGMLLLALGALAILADFLLLWPFRQEYWDEWFTVVFFRSFLGVAFILLLAGMVVLPVSARPSALWRAAVYLGEISYGLYLWHMIVLWMLVKAGVTDNTAFVLGLFSITTVLAALSYQLLEKPAMRWARTRLAPPFL